MDIEPRLEYDASCEGPDPGRTDDRGRDWRIVLEGPLSGRTYQRHGAEQWALVEQNMGFA